MSTFENPFPSLEIRNTPLEVSLSSFSCFLDWLMSSSLFSTFQFLSFFLKKSFSQVLLLIFINFDKDLYRNKSNYLRHCNNWILTWIRSWFRFGSGYASNSLNTN